MRRSMLIFTLAVTAASMIAFAPLPAGACSCAQLDPYQALEEYPAAFVGELISKKSTGTSNEFGEQAIYTFRVEKWLKGDLGDTVDVRSAANGAACGIETPRGGRAGVFLRFDEDGRATSSLCETVDADVLMAASTPLLFDGTGPPRLLIVGPLAGYDYVIVDDQGGLLTGLGEGAEGDENLINLPYRFSLCPGGDLLLEEWSWRLVVRDLTTMEAVQTISLIDFADRIGVISSRCMDEDASTIWIMGDEWVGDRSVLSIYDATAKLAPLFELPEGHGRLGPAFAVMVNPQADKVFLIDYSTGASELIHQIERGNSTSAGVVDAVPSPEGTRLVVLDIRYPDSSGTPVSTLVMYDDSGLEISRRAIEAETRGVDWLDEDRLLVNVADSKGLVVDAASLDTTAAIDGWTPWRSVVRGDLVYGMDGGRLLQADLASGTIVELALFPASQMGPIAVLASTAEVPSTTESDSGAGASPPPTETEPTEPTIAPLTLAVDESETNTDSSWPWVYLVGLATAAFASIAVLVRKRTD